MGMFDTVLVPCPKCGHLEEAQTKSGARILGYYDWPAEGAKNPAPPDVMPGIDTHYKCLGCGVKFQVNTLKHPVLVPGEYEIVLTEENDQTT